MSRRFVVLLLVSAAAAAGPERMASARTDAPIVQADDVNDVYALDSTILFHRKAGWMRVVRGRVLPASGVPGGAMASSIGRDADGRVVVTFRQWSDGPTFAPPQTFTWWAYDVARDKAREFAVPTAPQCVARSVALWRKRIAFAQECWAVEDPGPPGAPYWVLVPRGVIVTNGQQRLVLPVSYIDVLAMRGRSLAGTGGGDDPVVWRLLDRGRPCPMPLAGYDPDYALPHALAIRRGSVAWATARRNYSRTRLPYRRVVLTDHALTGRCERTAQVRVLDMSHPSRPLTAVAATTDALVYATERGLFRRRLAQSGSVEPPVNDDFADAELIRGRLPLQRIGIIGYATAQPGEPRIDAQVGRSVWYGFTPRTTQQVRVEAYSEVAATAYAGRDLTALKPLTRSFGGGSFCARRGRTYWLSVGAIGRSGDRRRNDQPSFRPFTLRISRAHTTARCRT